jgi:hypothetical protein
VWFEHRLLLGSRDDMRDIVRAVAKVAANGSELASTGNEDV